MNECRYSESKSISSTRPLKNAPVLSITAGTRHCTLLNSNEPPEDSEIPPIRSLISDADAHLARIDNKISKIQETLKQLEEERSSLLNYRVRNEGIISPLRRMPPEVLGEIFWWTLPSISEAQKSEIADSPWTLTYVSSRWRAVSLSNPSLWSQIVIDYDTELPDPLSLIEARIQRAHRQSLKIHFSGSEDVAPGPQIQMFQLLLQHSSRWEELSLTLTSQIVPLLTEFSGRLSSLKRLWIDWDDLEGQTDFEPLVCFFTAPSLVDVGISSEYRFVPVALPTYQLSRYHIYAPWAWHKNALKLATNLVEVYISAEFDDNQWPDTDEIIILRHLRRLFVSNPQILNYIVAPAPEELAFSLSLSMPLAKALRPNISSC
ncbi:hypothetical protein DFH08DRAFT_819139 [Mycena albidolilacea]|uniref:F-box domain-containing protein n=1 Tax=Mycena albidolilacea TaxID=1033008 RepID=A0AAD7EH21_9AGAR|nr:hypothetical protein DFH08DRAFT_819139 [Mycena albidolilacea]